MRILSRYVFREVLSSSLLAVAVATFIVFLQGPGKDTVERAGADLGHARWWFSSYSFSPCRG